MFDDGPRELGGKRYCLNSASLQFIAKKDLEEKGYGDLKKLFESTSDTDTKAKAHVEKTK